jgi:AcrR family transcriptional regulator
MAKEVKPRRYDSPRRREQAAATRRAILEAAEQLFGRHGYSATTMAEIAKRADVSLKTVYLAFETKSGVLRALWNLRLRGEGQEDVPIAEQPWYVEMIEEPDPARQLRLNARNSSRGKTRLGASLFRVIQSAAAADTDCAALWERIQTEYRANQGAICKSLAKKKALRRGLGVERATDILWTLNHPSVWLLLEGRGWTVEEYERWSGDLACAQLLK